MRAPIIVSVLFILSCSGNIDESLIPASCGDGLVNGSEDCDSGGANAVCDSDCTQPTCGDGHVNDSFIPSGASGPEQCDDGNTTSNDGCSASCQIETCGNGATETANGEECDDGNTTDDDACRNTCQLPRCGDGVVSAGVEECDSGAPAGNTQLCDFDCTHPACGDGVVNAAAGEECDGAQDDGCTSCLLAFLAGDIRLDFGDVETGQTSAHATWVITNVSTTHATSHLSGVSIDGPADFVIIDNTCTPQNFPTGLPALGSCSVELALTPEAPGLVTATATISAEIGGQVSAELAGFGIAGPDLVVAPTSVQFTDVPAAGMRDSTFLIVNTSDVTAGALIPLALDVDSSAMQVLSTDCGPTLAPYSFCNATVRFTAPTSGSGETFTGTFTAIAAPGGTRRASVSVTLQ